MATYGASYTAPATSTSQQSGVGQSASKGQSTSTSQATSTPTAIQTPQSQLELTLSQADQALANQQYQWALQNFANTSAVTNASIDNYLNASQQSMDLAGQTMQQYEGVTAPEINQQAQLAGTYTSPSRVALNMGMAESGQMQASNAALQSAKQNLQSYGINPSSGMYAELEQAQNTAGGAAAAGAGQQAQLATEATGRQLLASSIATGQQLPGQAINAINAGYQGVAGAENAALANLNTGTAATSSANPYASTAMSMKLPSVGNTSQSTSNAQSTNASESANTSQATSGSYKGPSSSAQTGGGGSGSNAGTAGGAGSTSSSVPVGTSGAGTSGYSASNYAPGMSNANLEKMPSTAMPGLANNPGGGVTMYSRGGDIGTGSPGDFSFAGGGDATQGGFVPQQASPSSGINVDDVPANLNAEEFVIPRDVARWKGEEFWHKEIAKSRAARAKAAATVGPTAGPPQQPGQQPSFTSEAYGGGGI